MASINVNRATSTLMSPAFFKSAVLIVVGSLLAQILTDYLRRNVYNIPFAGGDAVYPLVAALLTMAVMPGQYGRPMALGATATSVRVVADQFGIV